MNVIDFEQALKNADNEKSILKDALLSGLELCKEIAGKGMRGEPVTEAEDRFLITFTTFNMTMILGTMGVKKP